MDKEREPIARLAIKWDDLNIEREVAHAPEEVRDDLRWLKCYVREQCHRDIDVLVDRMKVLGVYHDRTTWSKVLRGRVFVDAYGAIRPTPVISVEKLQQAIEALRTNVRAEVLRGRVPFVMTSVAQSIFDYVDARRATDRVNRWGVIVGPTGSQKTATFKEYHRQRNHGQTWWMEAPTGGVLGELLNRLAACSGLGDQHHQGRKRAHLFKSVQRGKAIIIDNVQDLYRPGKTEQPVFSFLRQLQDETDCCVILSITPTFERELTNGMMMGYFEQFEGRSGGRRNWLRLPEHPPEEDVLKIAEAFSLDGAKKHLKELVAISREPGRVRRLFEDLQQGKILATADKAAFTIEHVREARGEE